MQDRRQILIGIMFALGGPAIVAGCDPGGSDDEILRSLRPDGRINFYSRREYRMVGVIADTIIPRTETPGAIEAGVPAYLDGMMATWASRETSTDHRQALRAIRARLREIGGKDILQLPDEERRVAITALDDEAYPESSGGGPFSPGAFGGGGGAPGGEQDVAGQYRALKSLITQVYFASEPGATEELQYELVPGRWLADAPLSEIGRAWAF